MMSKRLRPDALQPHPEGGRYQEVFRSLQQVERTDGGGCRSALTHIYFELQAGEISRFHRVTADEVWNCYRGAGVALWLWNGVDAPEEVRLEPAAEVFCHVVPAGVWQAARPLGEDVLVGCSVAPGFEFADFCLLDSEPVLQQRLRELYPELRDFV